VEKTIMHTRPFETVYIPVFSIFVPHHTERGVLHILCGAVFAANEVG